MPPFEVVRFEFVDTKLKILYAVSTICGGITAFVISAFFSAFISV